MSKGIKSKNKRGSDQEDDQCDDPEGGEHDQQDVEQVGPHGVGCGVGHDWMSAEVCAVEFSMLSSLSAILL